MAEREMYRVDLIIGTEGEEHAERQLRALDKMLQQTQRRAEALGKTRITPTVKLEDKLTSSAQRAAMSMSSMDEKMKSVHKHTDMAGQSMKKMSNHSHSASGGIFSMYTGMIKMAGVAALVTATFAPIAVAASSAKKAMDFEAEMSTIQALTGASNAEMLKMQSLAIKMGAATKYNALEAAQGIEELLKAGLTPAAVRAGALEAALNLATAGGLGLADAAEIMSTALNSYRRDNLTAAQASDILAGTANASATEVMTLRESLAQVSSVASGVGQSFKDTNIALGLFANNGLKGSDAGTSLKTMLANLVPSTDKAYNLFDKFNLLTTDTAASMVLLNKAGIKPASNSVKDINKAMQAYVARQNGLKVGTAKVAKATKDFMMANNLVHSAFYDEKGNLKDLGQIAGLLQNRFRKLTNEQRQFYLNEIFGSDAIRAGTILYKEGTAGVQKFQKAMSNVTALEVAKKKMDNAAGAVEQFKGAIETLQISALLPTMPIIKNLALAMADWVSAIMPDLEKEMKELSTKAEAYLLMHFLKNPEFNKLDLEGKVQFVIDDFQSQLDKWWKTSGAAAMENLMKNIGKFLGDGLEGTIMGALGLVDDGSVSEFGSAGESAGAAFFNAFIDSFDAEEIVEKLIQAFKNSTIETIQHPTPGNLLTTGLEAYASYALYKKFIKPIIGGGKSFADKAKKVAQKVSGKGGGTASIDTAAEAVTTTSVKNVASTASKSAGATAVSTAKFNLNTLRTDPRYRPGNKVVNPPKEFVKPGLKTASRAILPLVAAVDAYDIATADKGRDRAEKVGQSVGGWAGAWAGATAGGAVGSVFPGPGTAIGGIIGGIGGAFGGSWVGKKSADRIMDEAYGKKAEDTPVDAVLGGNSEGDAVLGRKPIANRVVNNSTIPTPILPPIKDIVNQTLASLINSGTFKGLSTTPVQQQNAFVTAPNPTAFLNQTLQAVGSTNSTGEVQTFRISPEQINSMENGIRNIKADTTNQFNITLPAGTVQVVVQGNGIDDETIEMVTQQVASGLAADMRRKTQNLK